jgi:hypothetical protein
MGHRCQIFIEGMSCSIYKHWGGHPDGENGVLKVLVPYTKKFLQQREWHPEYLMARLLVEFVIREDTQNKSVLSYGICEDTHWDLGNIYLITPNYIQVMDGTKTILQKISLVE